MKTLIFLLFPASLFAQKWVRTVEVKNIVLKDTVSVTFDFQGDTIGICEECREGSMPTIFRVVKCETIRDGNYYTLKKGVIVAKKNLVRYFDPPNVVTWEKQ